MNFMKNLIQYMYSTSVDLMLFKANLDDTNAPKKATIALGVVSSIMVFSQQLVDEKSIVAAMLSIVLWLAFVLAASKIESAEWNKIANTMFLISIVLTSTLIINSLLGNNQDAALVISFWCALSVLKVLISSIHKSVSNGFN